MEQHRRRKRPGKGSAARGELYKEISAAGEQLRQVCDELDVEKREAIIESWVRMKNASRDILNSYRETQGVTKPQRPRRNARKLCEVSINRDTGKRTIRKPQTASGSPMTVDKRLEMSLDDVIDVADSKARETELPTPTRKRPLQPPRPRVVVSLNKKNRRAPTQRVRMGTKTGILVWD